MHGREFRQAQISFKNAYMKFPGGSSDRSDDNALFICPSCEGERNDEEQQKNNLEIANEMQKLGHVRHATQKM